MKVCCLKNLSENVVKADWSDYKMTGQITRCLFSFVCFFVWFLCFSVSDLNLSCVCVFFYQRTFYVFGFCVSGLFVHLCTLRLIMRSSQSWRNTTPPHGAVNVNKWVASFYLCGMLWNNFEETEAAVHVSLVLILFISKADICSHFFIVPSATLIWLLILPVVGYFWW